MVAMIFTVVFASAFTSRIIEARNLPSFYDPGLKIDEAFKTSKTPLFIEFYSDECTTCRRMAPMVHELMTDPKHGFTQKLTLVMIDVADPESTPVAQLFGVDELPGLYVFDFKHMKKHQITSEHFLKQTDIEAELNRILEANPKLKTGEPG